MNTTPLFRGNIVLTRFPFTDLTGASLRPALVLSPGLLGQDVVLAGISSVLRRGDIVTDFVLQSSHPEFHLTGLRRASVFRMHKLAAVSRTVIIRRLGRISPQLQVELDRLLRVAVGL